MVKVKFTLDRRTDGQTDRQGDSYIPPPNFVCGGYNDLRLTEIRNMPSISSYVIIPPATKLGGGILESPCPSICPSVCRRARLGKIARLGIGFRGGYFVPLGQPHSSFFSHSENLKPNYRNSHSIFQIQTVLNI